MTKEKLKIKALEILKTLEENFVMDNGLLGLERKPNGILFQHHIFPDLGDFLPFFLYFSKEEFIEKQIIKLPSILKNEVLVSDFASWGVSGLAKTYEYTDFLVGLESYAQKNKSKGLELLIKHANNAIKIFNLEKEPMSFYLSKIGKRLPIFDTRDGTLVECYVDVYSITNERKYLEIAKNIYRTIISNQTFKKTGLLPDYFLQGNLKHIPLVFLPKKFKQLTVCKNHTNTLFGFLSLYRVTKNKEILEHVDLMVAAIEKKAISKSGGVNQYPGSTEKAYLLPSFALIDFLCDLYVETGREKYVNLAKKIAHFWMIEQNKKTGLMPMIAGDKKSFLDSETDMAIALFKLGECTNESQYSESAERIYSGIEKYHAPNGYVLSVDVKSGKVLDSTKRTKFVALYLKLLIFLLEREDGKKIYTEHKLWDILRDR